MTPEERQLINGLFERMRGFGAPDKDREAETLISEAVRATPDAAYMLVQSVLVQEHALQEAGNRIQDLEEQVRELQGAGRERTSGSGSFLGGLLGTGRPASEPRGGSVPQIGARATPSAYDDRRPWTPPPGAAQQAAPAAQAAAGGGGFLRSAMATAAGVAGGMLAAGAIRDLLGGSSAHAQASPASSPAAGEGKSAQSASDPGPGASDAGQSDGHQEVSHDTWDDDSSWDSGDLDI